jgi:hypothetical protein
MRTALTMALVAALALAASGCGDSGGGGASEESKKTTPATPSSKNTVGAFKSCVKKAGAKLKREPPTLKDRIAVGGAGNLPATYLGAVVWPNDAYMDVWLADDAANGAKTADQLNAAEARSEGVTEVEAAFNNGRAVGAPVNNPDTFGKLPLEQTGQIDDCLKATNG